MTDASYGVSRPQLIDFDADRARIARAHNFVVEWLAPPHTSDTSVASSYEMLLLLLDCQATIHSCTSSVEAPARSIAILPAGNHVIELRGAGAGVLIASDRPDLPQGAMVNGAHYTRRDPRVMPLTQVDSRKDGDTVSVIEIDSFEAPPDNPRLKMLRSATISINWCEYEGPRDRTKLSPHSHASFEQGSLALQGTFLHHFRVPWGANANRWRPDEVIEASENSLMVIPVELIHTTEGIGEGGHVLIDIFSPPRTDFVEKNWVYNAHKYNK